MSVEWNEDEGYEDEMEETQRLMVALVYNDAMWWAMLRNEEREGLY